MDLASFKFLSDENIHAELVLFIRELGFDIEDVITKGLQGKSDIEVLNHATENNRIVITQDSDFGRLAYTTDIDFKGIIYLRLGHISGSYHKETFKCILKKT
jgi:predicted nuclease of predicted toxin-antitoxin system